MAASIGEEEAKLNCEVEYAFFVETLLATSLSAAPTPRRSQATSLRRGTGVFCWLELKKCGSGQPPEPHLRREFRPLPAPPMARPRAHLPAPQRTTDSQLRRCNQHSKVRLHPIAPTGCGPAMRDRSEEAATPGCPRRLHALGTARQFTLGKTAAEPALRDHWQRVIHACSDCTF